VTTLRQAQQQQQPAAAAAAASPPTGQYTTRLACSTAIIAAV